MKTLKPMFDRKKYGGTFLSIDPGAELGWAMWSMSGPVELLATGECFGKGKTWQARADYSANLVFCDSAVSSGYAVGLVVIEWPAFWNNSFGQAVAGDVLKLCYNIGVIAKCFERVPVLLLPVGEWKGTMSKEVVTQRCIDRLIARRLTVGICGHAWDAVGIGLHAQGILLCN